MQVNDFLKAFRDERNLSVREFAKILTVSQHRLEKWIRGSQPNYEDSIKILHYFGVDGFDKFSEDFLKNFKEGQVENLNDTVKKEEILVLKDQLLEEKDKRIEEKDKRIEEKERRICNLEETIKILRSALADSDTKIRS